MRTVTLAQIREDIRFECDLPAYTTSSFVTETAVTRMINQSLQGYYGLLMECYGDDYFDKTITVTTQTDIDASSLPADFSKLRSLWWVRSTNDVIAITRASIDDMALGSYASQSWNTYGPRYRLQSQLIKWYPTPNAAYTLSLTYSAVPADLVNVNDTFDAGSGFESYVIGDVAARIAVKEEKDPSSHLYTKAAAEKRIRAQASERDESAPNVLRGILSHSWESDLQRRNRLTRNG